MVDDGSALDAALDLCERISAVAPLSVRRAKAGLRRADEVSFAQAIEVEMLTQHVARSTDDHREGLSAFLDRRPTELHGG